MTTPGSAPARPSVFRRQAVDGLTAPSDRLDALLRVTSPRGWIVLLALVAVVAAAVVYGVVGRVPTTVSGTGIFLPPGGLTRIDAPVGGTVTAVEIAVGDTVDQRSVVVVITPVGAAAVTVRSVVVGTITELLVDEGNVVVPGAELAVAEPRSDRVTAVMYLPAGQGKAVRPGMTAWLEPTTAPSEQYGQVVGTVTAISEFPVSSARLAFVLQDDLLERQISEAGAVLEVTVEVTVDPTTPSGLAWTVGDGAPFAVQNGTLATGSVVLSAEPPIAKLFGSGD